MFRAFTEMEADIDRFSLGHPNFPENGNPLPADYAKRVDAQPDDSESG